MNLLWQNKFDGFDLVRTSPLYYMGIVEREERALNCDFFDINSSSKCHNDKHIEI